MKTLKAHLNKGVSILKDETGRIGYLIAWLLGVPVSVLFVIFLIRGH
ncbi:MAG: hypothetical protein ACXVA9_00725 [Bdellovibrionales bacterium]